MSKLNAQGLKMIAEGLILLAQSIESSNKESVEAEPTVQKVTKTVETKEEKTAEVTESGSYTAEQLEEMSYNDIKKLAKSLGISAVGNRTALVSAILGVSEDSEEKPEAEDEEFEEVTSDEDSDSEDDSEDEDEEDTDEDDEDNVSAQVESAVADMSDDEIRELLADAELSTKGKRQALIARLVEAVEEGVIEFGDDEESYEDTDEDESEDDAEESDDGDVTKGMTKDRRAAYDQVCKDTESAFESGDITREDLIEFINDFNGTSDKFKKVSDEELLENYLTIAANLISDDGEVSEEPGLYYINDEPHCCGHPTSFNKKKNVYVCPVCGASYKA